MILMLQKRNGAHCQFEFPIVSSEILQMPSWAASFLVLYGAQNRKHIKFPWVLRMWWISSFFLSLARMTLDAHSVIISNEHPGLADYVDILGLIASACLLGISIRGKTGIIFDISDSTTEPLLNGKKEKHSEAKRDSPYGKASLLQQITFSWLNPLFEIRVKKPIDQDEVPDVDFRDTAKFLSDSFDESLKYVKERDGITNPSIYKAIYVFARKKAAINALFAVISAGAFYVGPYLIDDFVNFLNEKKLRVLRSGYLLALAFLGAKMVETIAQRQWIFGARQLGLRLRAALISHIYQKGLLLSSQSHQSYTSGEIINYMSVDVRRITDFIWYLNTIWMLPIQISLAIYILHMNLGMGALVALWATLIVMTGNIPISYLTTVKGGAFVPIILLAQSSFQVLQIASNYWMAWSCPTGDAAPIDEKMNFILFVYVLLAVGSSLCVLVRSSFVAITGLRTAEKLFSNMLHSILRAPMSFFDSTPTGRILNRVSSSKLVDRDQAIDSISAAVYFP